MVDLVRAMQAEGRSGPVFWGRLVWDTTTQAVAAWWAIVRGMTTTMTTRTMEDPMATLFADLRYALRRIGRQPLFSATVILLVAVGIAGNAAVFRLANGLFLRPLPFAEADRLVDLDETAPAWNLEYVSVSITDFRLWQESNETFESMTAFSPRGGNLAVDGGSTRVDLLATTHDAAEVFGLEPRFGRFYTEAEDAPDVPLVALLTSDFWESQFGSDPDVIGRTVQLGGATAEVIGVLPDEAEFLSDVDLWIPLQEDDESAYYLSAVGRLRDGATVEQARADLLSLHRSVIAERSVNEVTSPTVDSLRDRYLGEYRLGTGVLLGAVALVLLIACGNIAGLMVARSVGRQAEVSIRQALGAGRARLVTQLLTESVVLAGIGAIAGTALGIWGSGLMIGLMADQFPDFVSFDLDARFVAFSVVMTLGAAIVFGLLPALRGSGATTSVASATSSRTTASRGTRRMLGGLVMAEVAAAAVLLIVAGLAVRDARAVGRIDPGFDPSRLVTYRLQLDAARYPDDEARGRFATDYATRLAAVPGVESAVLATTLPLMGHSGWFFEVEGHERPEGDMGPVVLRRWVSTNYLEAMGLTLVGGRGFTSTDGRSEGESVVVVNESFVGTHVPAGLDPIGQRIHTGGDDPTLYTIVGVVRDVKHYGLDEEMRPGTYEPLAQGNPSFLQVALRSTADPLGVVPAARAATAELDPGLPMFDVQAMAERLDDSLLGRRSTTWLIAVFSGVALFLAVAGLYGVISYTVGQRAGEISVRMAMGAPTGAVSRQVVREGMTMVALGLLVGLIIARLAGGPISGLLVGVSPSDPWVFGGVTLLLMGVALVANWLPARRAAAINPMKTLRGE